MSLTLAIAFLRFGVHRDSNSQNGNSLGSVRVHSLTLFCTPWSMRCDSRASFLVCTLASPCFGHKPKARVVTKILHEDLRTIFNPLMFVDFHETFAMFSLSQLEFMSFATNHYATSYHL
jgi:hypothetical protein